VTPTVLSSSSAAAAADLRCTAEIIGSVMRGARRCETAAVKGRRRRRFGPVEPSGDRLLFREVEKDRRGS
jgi:hypothetical protein